MHAASSALMFFLITIAAGPQLLAQSEAPTQPSSGRAAAAPKRAPGSSGDQLSSSAERTLRDSLRKELKDLSYYDLRERRDSLESRLPALTDAKDKAEFAVAQWSNMDNEIRWLKEQIRLRPDDNELKSRLAALETALPRKDTELAEGKTRLDQAAQALQNAEIERAEILAEMTRRIDLEGPRHDFKRTMSITFACLVGLVIVGFFWMAKLDQRVRRQVFSGQSGLQFITLFSLVIAIILFGIVGILEGKELSALLGGLSGYILGRTIADRPTTTSPMAEHDDSARPSRPERSLTAASGGPS